MQMQTESSFGVVPFRRQNEQINYLLIHSAHIRNPNAAWEFPKGRPAEGESDIESACREFREETGLRDFSIIPDFRHAYGFTFGAPGGFVDKTVTLFLAEVHAGDPPDAPTDEHKRDGHGYWWRWLSFDEAIHILYYNERRDCLRAAHRFLTTPSSSAT
jgi:8-oxo-dGTP pyrophosphatase MutT (NUDIX family)